MNKEEKYETLKRFCDYFNNYTGGEVLILDSAYCGPEGWDTLADQKTIEKAIVNFLDNDNN